MLFMRLIPDLKKRFPLRLMECRAVSAVKKRPTEKSVGPVIPRES
jgi:hypothetical protein